jgi:hypothetical protein
VSFVKLAVTSAFFALCGSGLLAQQAGPSDYANLMNVLKKTCLATFPSFRGIEAKAKTLGFSQTKDGAWTNDDVFLKVSGSEKPVGNGVCWVNLRMKSDAKSVSNTLQTQTSKLGLKDIQAKRKGVRLSLDFASRGSNGKMRVEPLGGYTASIIVLAQSD